MSNPSPSPGNRPLEQLKVAELRDELRKRGLSLKGVKKDLFERLDEAVRKEQTGFVGDKESQGGYFSAAPQYDNTEETSQEDDGMSYLNDIENTQDTPLIVNNASPYVGASDASPVLMEPCKDVGRVEERKDDASIIGDSSLPENTGHDKAMPETDNLATTGNPVPEVDKKVVENVAASGNQRSESETVILDSGNNQTSEADSAVPEIAGHDVAVQNPLGEGEGEGGVFDSNIVGQEVGSTDNTVVVEPAADGALSKPDENEIVADESAVSAQESNGAEVASGTDVVILTEGDKDAPSASVSDDILNAADASVPAVDTVVNTSDSPMQDVEGFERNNLTSVNVVPSVQESVKEPDDGALKIGISEKAKEELVEEDTKKGGLLEGGESLETIGALPEAPMQDGGESVEAIGAAPEEPMQEGGESVEAIGAAPEVPVVEALEELELPVREETQRILAQSDSGAQEESKDIEMSEAHEDLSANQEVSESKPPTAVVEALEPPAEIKAEDIDNADMVDTGNLNEVSGSRAVDEKTSSVKSEPKETESRVSRRAVPVENVKLEQQDTKEESPRNGRTSERFRPRDYESDRPRHSAARTFEERGRFEGRSGRHFKEEGRKDIKETVPKPEEGTDVRAALKRKDDDRDAKQQEPAKRVRRWNSGNQPMIEVTKPLTSGTVNEIVSPEVKREDFTAAPPKLTPKLSGPVRLVPPAAKSGFEANGDKRAVPPSASPPSASLKIERFVRPFTLKAVKDLLAKFGECVDFWMDQIKTHCYVTYSKVDEAVAARNGLYDRQWPPSFVIFSRDGACAAKVHPNPFQDCPFLSFQVTVHIS
ncbi:hypothetical protein GOP47_0014525 [Adiantum capillus-veneris]|uniref:SAP domain-containing protein n=1 Tax=Adiantum capillus-veneris TaxID=13818 RepID=A0A9D4UMG4_ADICA|nr:hypothetical protein GOP47_0014525 [Adiantum capillus-veneris]